MVFLEINRFQCDFQNPGNRPTKCDTFRHYKYSDFIKSPILQLRAIAIRSSWRKDGSVFPFSMLFSVLRDIPAMTLSCSRLIPRSSLACHVKISIFIFCPMYFSFTIIIHRHWQICR